MMGRMGFCDKWMKWIKTCPSFETISVLVNGNSTKDFRPKGGLRQGDPLEPFLFLIVAEGLAGLVREASRLGVLEGLKVGHKHVDVKLLQFADDTLFFCQPKLNSILAIKTVLHCFEITSRLKVNFHKSHVGTIGVTDLDKAIFSKCLNCRCMGVPFKYLGMDIGGSPRSLAF